MLRVPNHGNYGTYGYGSVVAVEVCVEDSAAAARSSLSSGRSLFAMALAAEAQHPDSPAAMQYGSLGAAMRHEGRTGPADCNNRHALLQPVMP